MLLITFDHFGGVRRDIRLQQVCRIQLGEQVDHFALGRGVVAELPDRLIPDIIDSPLPVHQTDKEVDRRRKAVGPARRVVLDDVP